MPAPAPSVVPQATELAARLAASEKHRQRLGDFYRALRDMGLAITGLDDPQALYEAICRIVVESGRATMAWIGVPQGGHIVPVAFGGDAERYTRGVEIPLPPTEATAPAPGPTALAFIEGRPTICNDFTRDPRTLPWRERAAGFGVQASAAFPFRRAGAVAGTLSLYFAESGAFDPALIELVELMVADLGLALDHIDREAARQRAESAAQQRERQLTGIVETALDAIITVDARHRIVVYNQAAVRLFGVPADEALGQTIERFIPESRRDAHRAHMAAYASNGGAAQHMARTRELVGRRADGTEFPMEASISRVGEGSQLLMTVMARDVTQLRRAEAAQLAHAEAEAANRAKTEFLSRISHELRTPLNAVLGFAQLLQADAAHPLSARQREQVALVRQAGEHLRTLIDEMLDVSRIESGQMHIELRDFELVELLEGVRQLCAPQAADCGVQLDPVDTPAPTLLLHSDPARLRQVMLNLMTNAIKYNRRGGWVRVQVTRDRHFVHIMVRDNGLGMTPHQRAQLFQPFNRLGREGGPVQGTGIGLVLVKQLVGLLGGELAIDSEPGTGTAVRVTLPATDDRPLALPPGAAASPPPGEAPPAGRVLYVEDNPVNSLLVQQLLSCWPQVLLDIAPDGATGLAMARMLRPDVLLLDMQLPDMDGLALLRALKADTATAAVTVVALSAGATPQQVADSRAAGALDYWTKPIDFDAFLTGLRRLLPRPPRA